MGMIDRYKKRGGFLQLVNLLETMGGEKRDKYLGLIAVEAPNWEAALKQKMISMDRLSTWNSTFLMEFLPEIPVMVLATAFKGLTDEKRALFMAALPFAVKKKVEDTLKERNPTAGEIGSGQMKIINEARNMINTGKLKLDKCDPELIIPEDIEDRLMSSASAAQISEAFDAATAAAVTAQVAGGTGSAVASVEESNLLKRKIVFLTQENQRLQKEVNDLKVKVEAVRSALARSA
jgi:hypothetical protein